MFQGLLEEYKSMVMTIEDYDEKINSDFVRNSKAVTRIQVLNCQTMLMVLRLFSHEKESDEKNMVLIVGENRLLQSCQKRCDK